MKSGRRSIKLSGINGNGSNGVMSVLLPIGLNYYSIMATLVSGTASIDKWTDIKVYVNSEMIWQLTGGDIDEINKFDGLTAYSTNSVLGINFECQKFIDAVARYSTAINTGVSSPAGKSIQQFRLEITFSSATNPLIELTAEVDDADPAAGPGFIQRWQKFTTAAVVGEANFVNFLTGDDKHAAIRRLLIKKSSAAVISRVRILYGPDNEERFNRLLATNKQFLADGGKVVGSNFDYSVDFTERNTPEWWDVTNLKTGNSQFQFLFTSDTAETVTLYENALGTI